MIRRYSLDLGAPNPSKGNTAIDLNRVHQLASEIGFTVVEQCLLVFEPSGWGGDHRHERQELVVAAGDLTMVYLNEQGERVEESMGPDEQGRYAAYLVEPWEPHLVENRTDRPIALYELRDRFSSNYANLQGADSLRSTGTA